MTIPICARCSTPLTRDQGVYCSNACHWAAIRVQPRPCEGCGREFKTDRRQRYCSRPCGWLHQERPVRTPLLDILRANTHSWLTMSDLAIWVYGDDSPADCRAAKTLLYRLRREQHLTIVSRRAPWDARRSWGPARAYRLVEATAVKEAAA